MKPEVQMLEEFILLNNIATRTEITFMGLAYGYNADTMRNLIHIKTGCPSYELCIRVGYQGTKELDSFYGIH